MKLYLPPDYDPITSIRQTEIAIKKIKDNFERLLAQNLNLTRVSAPLFVFQKSGLNDDLSGVERPVKFGIKDLQDSEVEIVHSLAKWKRVALKRYGFLKNEGLYTDMNAIRRDEELDNTHSIYVDQWDWEKIISKEHRTIETLYATVNKIYLALKDIENIVIDSYPNLKRFLSEEVFFITSQELEDTYPHLSPEERENAICEKYGSVFISKIGNNLNSGISHGNRSPDYDDWELNGDLLVWYPILNKALELSSMGIRVDEDIIISQLKKSNHTERLSLEYHKQIIGKELPYTIGGGIGQSRICMFLLNKAHIGEVQATIWSDEMITKCENHNIQIL